MFKYEQILQLKQWPCTFAHGRTSKLLSYSKIIHDCSLPCEESRYHSEPSKNDKKKIVFCASISEDKIDDELEKQHHFSDSCVLPCKGGESLTKASTQCCAVCWADGEGVSVFKQGVTNSQLSHFHWIPTIPIIATDQLSLDGSIEKLVDSLTEM